MKRTISIIMAAAVFCAVFAAKELWAGERQGPRIYLPRAKHDLGKVRAGERVEHIFEIRNAGDDVLVIQKIQPS